MVSPVRGLRALRAGRFAMVKDPKPVNWTFLFFLSDAVIVPITLSRVSLAALALQPEAAWMTVTRCSRSLLSAGVALYRFAGVAAGLATFAALRVLADFVLLLDAFRVVALAMASPSVVFDQESLGP